MSVLVVQAQTPEGWAAADVLIRAYLAELPFEIDFQDLDRELLELPMEYGPPLGAALLAVEGDDAVGFVGVGLLGIDAVHRDDLDGLFAPHRRIGMLDWYVEAIPIESGVGKSDQLAVGRTIMHFQRRSGQTCARQDSAFYRFVSSRSTPP